MGARVLINETGYKMSRANDVIHQQTRLRIMATLNALPDGDFWNSPGSRRS
jgi:hypothetical protein